MAPWEVMASSMTAHMGCMCVFVCRCVCVSPDEMVREDTEHIHKMTCGEEADACVLVCSCTKERSSFYLILRSV